MSVKTSLQGLYPQLFWHLHLFSAGLVKVSGTRPEALFHSNLSAVVEPSDCHCCMHTRQPLPCQCHGKLSPGTAASLTPVPICPRCLQLCHCLGTGLRRGWAGLSKERLGFMAPQIAQAICTTEQDAADCGPKGPGLSSSSHLHCPLQCLADANGLWGRLPPDSEMPVVNFPSFLRSDKHSSSKTQSCVSTAAAGIWTPSPELDPALLGSCCIVGRTRESRE